MKRSEKIGLSFPSNSSDAFEKLRRDEKYPPLLQCPLWTLSAPFKEQRYHHSPSETIASNYTPSARGLKMANLVKFKKKSLQHPISRKRCLKSDLSVSTKKGRIEPMSPLTQKRLLDQKECHIIKEEFHEDVERYYYYVQHGVSDEMITPYPFDLMKIASKFLHERFRNLPGFEKCILNFSDEAQMSFVKSMKTAIVHYILMDSEERSRLNIRWIPEKFHSRTIQAPVPWRDTYFKVKNEFQRCYFVSSPVMLNLRSTWNSSYSPFRFINVTELKEKYIPCTASEFLTFVNTECEKGREILIDRWTKTCVHILTVRKDNWAYLVPKTSSGSLHAVEHFFSTVCVTMSLQLYSSVMENLNEWINLLRKFKEGNEFFQEQNQNKFHNPSLLIVKAIVKNQEIQIQPELNEIKDILQQFIEKIVHSTKCIPRVEKQMFPEMANDDLFLFPVNIDNIDVEKYICEAKEIFYKNSFGIEKYLNSYSEFLCLIDGTSEKLLHQYLLSNPSLISLKQKLIEIKNISETVRMKSDTVYLNMLCLDCSLLNKQLIMETEKMQNLIIEFKLEENRKHTKQICESYDEMSKRLTERPENTAELMQLSSYFKECFGHVQYSLVEEIQYELQRILFLMDYPVFTDTDIQMNNKIFHWPSSIKKIFNVCKLNIKNQQDEAEQALPNRQKKFHDSLKRMQELANEFKTKESLNLDEIRNNVMILDNLEQDLLQSKEELQKINKEESLLGWITTVVPSLSILLEQIQPYIQLWHTTLDLITNHEKWYNGPFNELDAEEVAEEINKISDVVTYLEDIFVSNSAPKRVTVYLKKKLDQLKLNIPVLKIICNPGMKPRHWEKIGLVMDKPIAPVQEMSLAEMVQLDIGSNISKIEEIAASASKEFLFENTMNKMKEEWEKLTVELIQYQDTEKRVLSSCEDIQTLLDENILRIQTIGSSPFAEPMKKEIKDWETMLVLIQDILDAWFKCQSSWIYLEPIFNSEDIMRQMPEEGQKFSIVDEICCNITKRLESNNNLLLSICEQETLTQLNEANDFLEDIQKGLNEYLEKKRMKFPRFYFISNDELLEILSETKEPQRVQPHLKKCFEGIARLRFVDEDEIIGMVSAEDEIVPFSQHIFPEQSKGRVERWMAEIEKVMVKSLISITNKALEAYNEKNERLWLLQYPEQIIICCTMILWTANVQHSITERSLQECIKIYDDKIKMFTTLMQKNLNSRHKITFETLTVLILHACEILRKLSAENICDSQDFDWQSQLRYYWENEKVVVSMINTNIQYGFEYLGNYFHLIITPLTERCYRSMMLALQLHYGNALYGPLASGKTSICKDFAKAIAKKCVIYNCSQGITLKAAANFFKGIAQTGSWLCLDEFYQVELNVLSVLAQHIQSIYKAIDQQLRFFPFEETDLFLNPTCSIFVTVNNRNSRQSNLPNNLKALFRPVAVIIPDYFIICENFLLSIGFVNAKLLSKKLTTMFKLCKELLSHQKHYDFSMATLKSVLLLIKHTKELNSAKNEDTLVAEAMNTINIPKLITKDLPLYEGIVTDLFPNSLVSECLDNRIISEAIINSLQEKNLQFSEYMKKKIIQLYNSLRRRQGIIIVGSAMSGKTTTYKTLASALEYIYNQRLECNIKEFKVIYQVINPKSVTVDQLYGAINATSSEWKDGIIPTLFREYVSNKSIERKWMIFDGPVDASWAENLNTLLDDNNKLCLKNGEMISMNNKMNIIFEVEDLDQASPAIVSRCDIIFMDSEKLGWQLLRDSFMRNLPNYINEDHKSLINSLFEWLIPPCIEFLQQTTTYIKTSFLHLFQNLINLYKCLLDDLTSDENNRLHVISKLGNHLKMLFIFSIVWTFGGILDNNDCKKFDCFYRQLLTGSNKKYLLGVDIEKKAEVFPAKGLVYEFLYDTENCSWKQWSNLMKMAEKVSQSDQIINMFVPTTHLVQLQYFLSMYITFDIPVLFFGPSSAGKTCLINNYLNQLPKERYITTWINFSANTTANNIQDIFMSKLDRRRKGVYGPSVGKKCIIFIDDLNMPKKQQNEQSPLELLRQWLDHGYWYDQSDCTAAEIVDIQFVSAMSPLYGNSKNVTPRFIRHTNVLMVNPYDDDTVVKIFSTIMQQSFTEYSLEIQNLRTAIISATHLVYTSVISTFLPVPAKCHYIFHLQDFYRVLQGLLTVSPIHIKEKGKFICLWIHEVYRVFHDRLVDDFEKEIFFDIVKETTFSKFGESFNKLFKHLSGTNEEIKVQSMRDLLFGEYVVKGSGHKIYDEVTDFNLFVSTVESCLEEYNLKSKAPMNLVIFKFAIEHLCRICRILKHRNGHLLIIGTGGNGRQSIVRFASYFARYELLEIKITNDYSKMNWKDDLKKALYKAGTENKASVFLLNCSHVKDESFLEDVNMLLKTGDVPNLFGLDEKAEIYEKMQCIIKEQGKKIDMIPSALYDFFINCIHQYLHIILVMSPTEKCFRKYLRTFPSLVRCCTVNWFQVWPDDALETIAKKLLKNVSTEETRESCVQVCKYFHKDVSSVSEKYCMQTQRHNYVTSTSYIELILTFKKLLAMKQEKLLSFRNRYTVGLERLKFAASQISVMQNEIESLQPQLMGTSQDTEKLMVKIEQDTVEVEAKKEVVAADEAMANKAAAASQAIKDDCVKDLSEAIPAMESAVAALNTLKSRDITVVKSMKNPPAAMKLVMEAICIMLNRKPVRVVDVNGRVTEDYWPSALKMLGDMKFLEKLQNYQKDDIPPHIMKKIREEYIQNPEFDPAIIKNVSRACEGLCCWVKAIDIYDRVTKVVAPKKAKLAEAEKQLIWQMKKLEEKKKELQNVTDKLQALNDEFASMTKQKKELEDSIEICSKKLERAERLLSGLEGERKRWIKIENEYGNYYNNIVGDILLSAAEIVYLGNLTAEFRNECIKKWHTVCKNYSIPRSENFSLINTLGDETKIREWQASGLPVDDFTIKNCIITQHSRHWCLMIDPQGQANDWIRCIEKENHLMVIRFTDNHFITKIETAVKSGHPVLLENIGETLDPIIDSILMKLVYKISNVQYVQIGESVVEYSEKFKLYITTRLHNPHYLPEVQAKVTVLNFAMNRVGLENKLLKIVAAKEKPELEEKKSKLIIESEENKRKLQEIEDTILKILSSSQGNILEDETAIRILSSSKVKSEKTSTKQETIVATQQEIDDICIGYHPVASHATVIFFCISDLVIINPMYQYSLSWFLNLYVQSIDSSSKSDNLEERIKNLNSHFTDIIYENINCSLFYKHKLFFSFLLCVRLLWKRELIDEKSWNFLLDNGTSSYPSIDIKNPAADWLPDQSWQMFSAASNLPNLKGLIKHICEHPAVWKELYYSSGANQMTFPDEWRKLTGLDKLVVLKCLGSDRLLLGIENFIAENLGKKFIQFPVFNLSDCYSDMSSSRPVVVILSSALNIEIGISRLKEEKDQSIAKLHFISLGQDQESYTERILYESIKTGSWVVLQNCHLSTNWLPCLERIYEKVILSENTDKNFRLWLTSCPCLEFPVSILLNAIKVINEIPTKIKDNLLYSFTNSPLPTSLFSKKSKKFERERKVLFLLCFFNAVVQERKNYVPVGWTIPYEFNDVDMHVSRQFFEGCFDKDNMSWKALKCMITECNYGGYIANEIDQQLLSALFSTYCNEETIKQNAIFTENDIYRFPPMNEINSCIEYIHNFSSDTLPEIVGLHNNALIIKGNQDTKQLFENLKVIQSNVPEEHRTSSMDVATEIANDIINSIPEPFDINQVIEKYPPDYKCAMNVVLIQEIDKYNCLINTMLHSLKDMQKVIMGFFELSDEMEEFIEDIISGKVPVKWVVKSYPFFGSLTSFISGLLKRLNFFTNWIEEGLPKLYSMSAFYFPHSFLIGCLQLYARNNSACIDDLKFHFEVLDEGNEHDRNEDFYIQDLFLEGAQWNCTKKCIMECSPRKFLYKLPIIWFKPVTENAQPVKNVYRCPVYRTRTHHTSLSSSQTNNHILTIALPSDMPEDHWIKRAVVIVCQLDGSD